MILGKISRIWIVLVFMTGCGGADNSPVPNLPNGNVLPVLTGANVLPLTVNGSLCSTRSYINKPCVSVTVCTPGTSTCQTIHDILLDTGSYGLRVFKSVLTVELNPILTKNGTNSSDQLAECVQFGDGSSEWGPVELASVVLGGEPPVQVPVHVIDSTFSQVPESCGKPDSDPEHAGFNGILGVGLFAQDCGWNCEHKADNKIYYGCSDKGCSGTKVSLTDQVQNPVTLLPLDNNGSIVELPSIPFGGQTSVNGYLVLGIGTRTNNVPSNVIAFPADVFGEFSTVLNGTVYSSFIDTGSNGIFFTPPDANQLPNCDPNGKGWFCPSSRVNLSATTQGLSGSPTSTVSFQIGNILNLVNSPNHVFTEVGGSGWGAFDWGLPFYLGRNVYVGFENASSSLGEGPYWAY